MPSQTFFNLPEEKREALIKIAIAEFSSHDYNSASISRIVKEAGIAKGSFYQYFQNKQDLYLYLLDLLSKTKSSFLQGSHPPKTDMDFFEYLSWLFETSTHFDLSYPELSRLGYRAFYGDSPVCKQKIEEAKEPFSEFIRQIVIKGISEGDIDPNIDLDLVVFVVDTLSNAFSNYVPKKLGITPNKLAQEGASNLDIELAKDPLKELVQILLFGLSSHQEKVIQNT
jgi:AcrR family transcriptional regulator